MQNYKKRTGEKTTMKKLIAIFSILLFLVAICTLEEIFIHNFTAEFNNKTYAVSQQIKSNQDNLTAQSVKKSFETLENFWQSSKTKLCYLTNYEKIKNMDESFVRLEAALNDNDKALAIENIAVIKNYTESLHYIMGFNLNNLF